MAAQAFATPAAAVRARRVTPGYLVAVPAAFAGFAVASRLPGPVGAHAAGIEVSFVSLFAESLPFLLAGALLTVLLRGRVGHRLLLAAAGHRRLAAVLAPLTGAVLPLCDCGVLPLARELRTAGGGRAVAGFVAGAPIVNPIVVVSTLVAFPGRPVVALGRVLAGLGVAMAVAALAPAPRDDDHDPVCAAHGEDHDHDHDGRQGRAPAAPLAAVGAELAASGPALVVGALLAATVKGLVPTSAFTALDAQPLLLAAAMMLLAFVMSICSQADAFVAASLPVGALPRLAFLVMGPILDLRLAVLYGRAFGARWVAGYAAVAVPVVLLLATVAATAGLA